MRSASEVQIVAFEPRHAEAFKDLNLAWIEEHFEVEEIDRTQLLDPEASILRPGGAILVAEDSSGVLGVCALLYEGPGLYEVSKMAVRRETRGLGVGRQLLSEAIAHARRLGAHKLTIFSNTLLEPAIHLYREMGFTEIPLPGDSSYDRCNISLELTLP